MKSQLRTSSRESADDRELARPSKAGQKRGGWKLSPEACAKISAANRRRKLSPETRAKIGAGQRGRKLSPDALAKITAINRSPEKNNRKRATILRPLTTWAREALALGYPRHGVRAAVGEKAFKLMLEQDAENGAVQKQEVQNQEGA